MGNPYVGVNSFIGIGEQTSYDSPVGVTKYVPMLSGGDSVKRNDATIESNSIDSVGYKSTRYRKGKIDVSGSENIEISYEGTELFWEDLFGTVTTSQPNAGGAPTVYDHTFTVADALKVGLTLEINRGSQSFRVTGAKMTQIEISQELDKLMEMNMSFSGRALDIITASTATFSTTTSFASPDAQLTWNGTAQDCSGFKLTMNQNIDNDRYFIGSRLRNLPVRAGRLEFTGSFDTEFQSTTLYTDFINATQRQIVITSTGDFIGATGYNYTWRMTIPIALLTDATPTVGDGGKITFSPAFKSYRSAGVGEATLLMRNTLSSF